MKGSPVASLITKNSSRLLSKSLPPLLAFHLLCRERGRSEDVRVGVNKFTEQQPIGTAAQYKDYRETPPVSLFEASEPLSWSFYHASIAEFVATFLFLYITILTVIGVSNCPSKFATVGIQGIAWAFGGMIFALVYCTADISSQ